MKIKPPTAEQVIKTNEYICKQQGNPFLVLERGKIESALHTAFYPGSDPFSTGNIARIAGALCFYLVKAHAFLDGNKRTGALTAITFMRNHGQDLTYPQNETNGQSSLTNTIEQCSTSKLSKDELVEWFDLHKTKNKGPVKTGP